jgi:hypothetical protein
MINLRHIIFRYKYIEAWLNKQISLKKGQILSTELESECQRIMISTLGVIILDLSRKGLFLI